MKLSVCLVLFILNQSYCITLKPQGIQYYKCDCSVFENQFDCDKNCNGNWCLDSGCTWNNSKCQNPKCSSLTFSQCDKFPNCYVNSMGYCVDFQLCTQVDSILNSCRGQGCYQPDPATSNYNCLSSPSKPQKTCSLLTTQSQCNESQQDLVGCVWLNGSCIRFACSVLTSKSDCNGFSEQCIYTNGSCIPLKCENFLTESQCTNIYDITNDAYILCMFIQNKCINPTLSQLNTQDLCSVGTLDTYAFISGSCQQCKKQDPVINPTPVPDPPIDNTNQRNSTVTDPPNTNTTQPNSPITDPPNNNTTQPNSTVPDPPKTNTTQPNSTVPDSGTNSTTPHRRSGSCKFQELLFVIANIILFILQ